MGATEFVVRQVRNLGRRMRAEDDGRKISGRKMKAMEFRQRNERRRLTADGKAVRRLERPEFVSA